ncbi:Transcription factor jumonji/aspartyl beta-hydroxylase [Moelleriella libera RCEF 2490]|uniref:Transcription factor jumonji/aspartyl beta-hydroxylase n=1 Tax=Moelleriella libera RCEF 2490 TaxID=1081109 RepID=A0A168D668_9HYPO|nr:Transcription factor jumonji/aspartyl beta-hydroxylase [Moelleriella libera RCEF 2490]
MGIRSSTATLWRPYIHSSSHRRRASLLSVNTATTGFSGHVDIEAFRRDALIPKEPLVFRRQQDSPAARLPALSKWFVGRSALNASSPLHPFAPFLINEFQDWCFPYELIKTSKALDAILAFQKSLMASEDVLNQFLAEILQTVVAENTDQTFFQIHAPLRLLVKAIEFNSCRDRATSPPLQLYIAQSALTDLPQPLQQDLQVPDLVCKSGKGDVYSSSIWLGTEPTYTPLHRDPNPNLFCQLWSKKVVRLMPAARGDRLFFEVQVQLQRRRSSRIRTTDMMQGEERKALHDAVWRSETLPDELCEVELDAGDALFIPDGWWHSVRSTLSDGELNGSVNWWFR